MTIQKSIVFLLPMDNLKVKLRKPFIHNSIKKKNIFLNKFNKRNKELYVENYKILLKEIKDLN